MEAEELAEEPGQRSLPISAHSTRRRRLITDEELVQQRARSEQRDRDGPCELYPELPANHVTAPANLVPAGCRPATHGAHPESCPGSCTGNRDRDGGTGERDARHAAQARAQVRAAGRRWRQAGRCRPGRHGGDDPGHDRFHEWLGGGWAKSPMPPARRSTSRSSPTRIARGEPLTDDPPGRERHLDRVLGLRDRPGQEGEAHYRSPCQHGPQFRGVLRVLGSLQFTAGHSVATRLNCTRAEDVIM